MFMYMKRFAMDISGWNMMNAKTLDSMFVGTTIDNDLCDFSKWDVSNVKRMRAVFKKTNFNGDISSWDVSNVETMSQMFMCSSFNGNISGWNTGNVKYFTDMFKLDYVFSQDISGWDFKSAVDVNGMLHGTMIKQNDSEKWKGKIKSDAFSIDDMFKLNILSPGSLFL